MTLNDLGTVKEHQLPIKIAIMNDHRQQMVHVWQRLFFDNRLMATHNVNPDYVALAKSYDIESYCCRHVDELLCGVGYREEGRRRRESHGAQALAAAQAMAEVLRQRALAAVDGAASRPVEDAAEAITETDFWRAPAETGTGAGSAGQMVQVACFCVP